MATAKTVALEATPIASATTPVKVATKTVAAKSASTKAAAKKKLATSKSVAKKLTVKKPLSQAFANSKTTRNVEPIKPVKPKKPKLVRDSFTIPKIEYLVLEALKLRATKLTRSVKKSELLRAGIKALAALSDAAFLSALKKVPAIKTGRPASAK